MIVIFIIGDDKNFQRGQYAFDNRQKSVPRNIGSQWEQAL